MNVRESATSAGMKRSCPAPSSPARADCAAAESAAPQEPLLSDGECSTLAAALIQQMGSWFEAEGGAARQLVCAFLGSAECERSVVDMLLAVQPTAPAAKVPAALAAIRINFGDALEMFLKKDASERDDDWRRTCVYQLVQSWTGIMPQLCRIALYKLNKMYPQLPDSWRRSLLFTEEATFSITGHASSLLICDKIVQRGSSADATIVDAFACVGGDTANFTRRFRQVHSIELDPVKIPLLRHNLRISLSCPFLPEDVVEPPSDMLSLPANLRIHMGDCRAVIPTLLLVRFYWNPFHVCHQVLCFQNRKKGMLSTWILPGVRR
jgi:hypothetical protein